MTFQWSAMGNPVTEWQLWVGTTSGTADLGDSGILPGATLAWTASGLPTDGSILFATLRWRDGTGPWGSETFQYTAASIPEITSPAPGSTLAGLYELFEWVDNGAPAVEWWVNVGSTPGGNDGASSGSLPGSARAWVAPPLPPEWNDAYVTLAWKDAAGVWDDVPFQYVPHGVSSVVDNTDPGFAVVGSWDTYTLPSDHVGSNYRAASRSPDGSKQATWTVAVPSQAQYAVYAQWPAEANNRWRSRNAPYTLVNNGLELATVFVDQTRHSGKLNYLGTFLLNPGTLDVVLQGNANGWVAADAVAISRTAFDFEDLRDLDVVTTTDLQVDVASMGFPVGWGVEFVVDGNTAGAVQDYTPPYSHLISNIALAEHTVDANLIDETGAVQLTSSVSFGAGDDYVALGDSITRGSQDDIPTDDTSLDGRNGGGGFEPILNDRLTFALGLPHSVHNFGVGGETAVDGLARIGDVLGGSPWAQAVLIAFGTNDALVGTASGLGLLPGAPGYAGSFKDYMTQLADAVIQAGLEPIFAKIPFLLAACDGPPPFPDPPNAPENVLVREFNQVIDEVAFAKPEITVVPPDFYGHFELFPGELAPDGCHPDGTGYQSMAGLWEGALLAP